jgi:hypothetical protein
MSRTSWIAFVIGCLVWQAAAQAATVTVTGSDPRHSITLTVEDATIDLVLQDLQKRYGFEVDGLQNANKGEAQSVVITGSLQSIIERLLRNWNHMIVRSISNQSGIEKVMILNATYGSTPPRQGTARGETSNKLMPALTGESIN